MCRFAAYLGKPIIANDLLFNPTNSLVKQSIRAREAEEPLNGDGFGLGWYDHSIDFFPALYRSIQPAWNDTNLLSLSAKIRTNCVFAHVRAATMGGVSIYNCHPFQYNRLLFMQNGEIGSFIKIKRHMRHLLTDPVYDWIQGQTDSEHFFALLMQVFIETEAEHSVSGLKSALLETVGRVKQLQQTFGVGDSYNYLNLVLTDGMNLVSLRYSDDPQSCPTLYYAAGSSYEVHNGIVHLEPPCEVGNEAVLVVSEKLSDHKADWHEVPTNHMLLVRHDLQIHIEPFEI